MKPLDFSPAMPHTGYMVNILESLFTAIESARGPEAAAAAREYAAKPKPAPEDWDVDYEAIYVHRHGEIPWRVETGYDPR